MPDVPEIPTVDGADEKKEDEKEPAKDAEEPKPDVTPAQADTVDDDDAPKSPNLASHRISVTSMDDVSLEEGKFLP